MAHSDDGAEVRSITGNLVLSDPANPPQNLGDSWVGRSPIITCLPTSQHCTLTFTIQTQYLSRLKDNVELFYYPKEGVQSKKTWPYTTTHIHLLRSSLLPQLASVEPGSQRLHGSNLIFNKVQFGNDGPTATLECADIYGEDCIIPALPEVTSMSYVYLVQDNGPDLKPVRYPLPLMSSGSTGFWTYVSPAKPANPIGQPKAKVTAQPAKAPSAPKNEPTIKIYMYEAKPAN
jgi:hypothetical protein